MPVAGSFITTSRVTANAATASAIKRRRRSRSLRRSSLDAAPYAEVVDLDTKTFMRENGLTVPPIMLDARGNEIKVVSQPVIATPTPVAAPVKPAFIPPVFAAAPPIRLADAWDDLKQRAAAESKKSDVIPTSSPKNAAEILDDSIVALNRIDKSPARADKEKIAAPVQKIAPTPAGPTQEQLGLMREFHLSMPPTILDSRGSARTTATTVPTTNDCPQCRGVVR